LCSSGRRLRAGCRVPGGTRPGGTVVIVPTGPVTLAAAADANPWVSYGLHAGFLFW